MMRNILIIDDEERIAKSLSIWFKEMVEGSEVNVAYNLSEAKGFLSKKRMDLIVSDYNLGNEKGTDLFKESNANLQYSCPVIFLTGHGTKEVMKEIANKQVYNVIEKGTTMFSEIEPIIRKALVQKDHNDKLLKMEFIGNNTSTLIHEINNPLTVILTKINMIQQKLAVKYPDSVEDEYLKKSFKALETSAERLLSLMRKTKGVINGQDGMVYSNIKFSQFIEMFLEENREFLFSEKTMVKTNIEKDFHMKVDIHGVYQVFSNLLSNSIDALNEKKEIMQKRISITARNAGSFNEIIFEDNGPGIPPALKDKIFEHLFTTKEGSKGTGLGLSVCKNIVNQHMGEFTLDKESDKARFIIRFPVVSAISE